MADAEQHYLWLDLETTGLDPVDDQILEVGWLLQKASDLGKDEPVTSRVLRYRTECQMQHFVWQMHEASGLLAALGDNFQTVPMMHVEQEIAYACRYVEKPILAGASVHFDRSFLRVHMPELEARLHHRNLDTSTLKMFFDSVGVPRLQEDEGAKHRAAADIKHCLAVVRHYHGFTRNESDLEPPDCDGED